VGTQTIATLIAVYGVFMAPLGWKWAGFVWAYALAWALINDRVKLLAYRIFDPIKKAIPQTAAPPTILSRSRPGLMRFTNSEFMAKASRSRTGLKRSGKPTSKRRQRRSPLHRQH
jgi:hypothetical protein